MDKRGRVLELLVYLAILITVILLSVFGKIPKPKEIEIKDNSVVTPPVLERVQ